MLDEGAQPGLACAERGGALVDAAFEGLRHFEQGALRYFPLADVPGNDDMDVLPSNHHGGRRDLDRDVPAIPPPNQPFEPVRLLFLNDTDDLLRLIGGARTIRLNGRRELF